MNQAHFVAFVALIYSPFRSVVHKQKLTSVSFAVLRGLNRITQGIKVLLVLCDMRQFISSGPGSTSDFIGSNK